MYGRMTRLQGSTEAMEKGIADYEAKVAMPASQQPGFQGIVLLLNRDKGEALSVSYWRDEEALKASEAFGNQLRNETAESSGMTVAEVATAEILDMQRTGPPRTGTFIRLNTVDGQADKLDAGIEMYKSQVIPVLKECPGFLASILSVNRQSGRMIVSTVWSSAQEREASDARLSDLRRKSGEAAGSGNVKVELFESAFVNMPAAAPTGS